MDPGSGRKSAELRRLAARSANICAGYDTYRRVFVFHAWAARATTSEMRHQIFLTNAVYKPRIYGIEGNAQQTLFAGDTWDFARAYGVAIPLHSCFQPTGVDKNFRIKAALQEKMAHGKLLIHESLVELLHEIESFPMSPMKDLIDALASLCALVPPPIPRREIDEAREQRLQRLRHSNAPIEYIQRVARGEA